MFSDIMSFYGTWGVTTLYDEDQNSQAECLHTQIGSN